MYKSSNFRNSKAQSDDPADQFRAHATELQGAFPQWSYDDIHSLLVEVNGDVNLASTRIIEGNAEQWGSVNRKKDKKSTSTSSHSKDSLSGRERSDFRGGRGGGRPARGGPRGGAARGVSARGAHHDVNGHRAKSSLSTPDPKEGPAADAAPTAANGEVAEVDVDSSSTSAWTSSTPVTWGGDTAAINGTSHTTPASASVPAPAAASAPVPAKVVSKPATSKLSWAQIARKQEKPTPPTPALPPVPMSISTPPPAPAQQPESIPAPEAIEPTPVSTGWEEPTTVQAPTWDDEPRSSQQTETILASVAEDEPILAQTETAPAEENVVEHVPAPPAVVQQPTPEPVIAVPVKPLTPSISTRPTPVSHRAPKFKTSDQPVVLPASFGSGIEKIGMQFGSLSLGGEDFDAPTHDIAPVEQKIAPPTASEPPAVPAPAVQPPEPVAPVASLPPQTALTSGPLFQSSQSTQQQPQQQAPHVQQSHQPTLPASLSQPAFSTQTSLPSSTVMSSISPYSQQPQQPLTSHQSQNQSHHSYGQHALDQVQSQPQQQAQGQTPGGPSSYFRQSEQYFTATPHTPTPPVGPQESPYGAFGQLASVHQGQTSHLNNFGGADYGYGESQRNFYDSYSSGPTGFGNRNVVLGHDEIKSLPGGQQVHGAPGLPPTSAQSSQQQHASSSQSSSQPNTNGPQGYMPYFYPHPGFPPHYPPAAYPSQSPAYPSQLYRQWGPQAAPSKQAPSAVPTQTYAPNVYAPAEPYGGEIGYQVGQSVGLGTGAPPPNEYGKHQLSHQHGHSGLYAGVQGVQNFMGQSGSGPTVAPNQHQRTTAASPENAYKPYGKEVGAGVGVGQASVGQVPQGRGQATYFVQRQPQGQPQQQQGQGPLSYPQGNQDVYGYQRQFWQ